MFCQYVLPMDMEILISGSQDSVYVSISICNFAVMRSLYLHLSGEQFLSLDLCALYVPCMHMNICMYALTLLENP